MNIELRAVHKRAQYQTHLKMIGFAQHAFTSKKKIQVAIRSQELC